VPDLAVRDHRTAREDRARADVEAEAVLEFRACQPELEHQHGLFAEAAVARFPEDDTGRLASD
jgi:hypothetical protein